MEVLPGNNAGVQHARDRHAGGDRRVVQGVPDPGGSSEAGGRQGETEGVEGLDGKEAEVKNFGDEKKPVFEIDEDDRKMYNQFGVLKTKGPINYQEII